MTQAQQILALTTAVLGLVGLVTGYYRFWRPRWRKLVAGARLWWSTQVGSDAITHPVTGDIIQAAQKGVAHRLHAVEQGLTGQSEILARAIALLEGQQELSNRIDGIDHRLTVVERGTLERTVVRAESAALLNLVAQEAASHGTQPEQLADPPPDL